MTSTLERLVYESIATGSTGSLTNLVAILAESQRNNEQRGLTGVLAAHHDRYLQVIEGPGDALDALLRRLTDDPRHRAIRVLDRRPITARQFTVWAMASPRINPETTQALDRLMIEPDPSPGMIVRLLCEALSVQTLSAETTQAA